MKKLIIGLLTMAAMLIASEADATLVSLQGLTRGEPYITDLEGNVIEHPEDSFEFDMTPGQYRAYGYGLQGNAAGWIQFEVPQPEDSNFGAGDAHLIRFSTVTLSVRQSEELGDGSFYQWQLGTDYTASDPTVASADGEKRILSPGEPYSTYFTFMTMSGDSYDMVFTPTEKHSEYMPTPASGVSGNENSVEVFFYLPKNFTFSFPTDAEGAVMLKVNQTHYIPFKLIEPVSKEVVDGMNVWTYQVTTDSKSSYLNYRVSRPGSITHAGIFNGSKTDGVTITDEQLNAYDEHYCTHDLGGGTHYADIFLNINKRNLLRLDQGQKFQIVNLRTWQLTNSQTGNYFIEPSYTWTVLNTAFQPDQSVIEIDSDGVITAKAPGTAIVQVRYCALNIAAMGGDLWSELWAENTGTFVVTVGADEAAAPADNIRLAYKPTNELDCEHDILYYMEGEPGYKLTFTPAEGSTVTVANPLVDIAANTVSYPDAFSAKNVTANADGSVTVLLTFGRNIICTTDAAGNANYQVLSAKPVTASAHTARTDDKILPGDDVTVQFSGLFHVAGKLAGIYNSNCYVSFNGVANGSSALGNGQYDFAGNAKSQAYPVKISADATGEITLADGCLSPAGYGSRPGAHRAVTYTVGINPNFNAGIISGEFGSIPSPVIPVTPISGGLQLAMTMDVRDQATAIDKEALEMAVGTDYSWTSSDPAIATVDADGLITAVSQGSTTVKCTWPGADPIEVSLTINKVMPSALTLNWLNSSYIYPDDSTTEEKTSYTFAPANTTNQAVTYELVSGDDVVSVEADGTIHPLKAGKFNLQVRSVDNPEIVSNIREGQVYQYAKSLSFAQDVYYIDAVGERLSIAPDMQPEAADYAPDKWESSDKAIATVSSSGRVTAKAEGTVEIKAYYSKFPDVYASCLVKIGDQTAIQAVESYNVSYYPNPCESYVTVSVDAGCGLFIYSLQGQLMLQRALTAGENSVDVSILHSGLYIMQIANKTHKLIKK